MTYIRSDEKGMGCFGTIDLRYHACQTCGDYDACKEWKKEHKKNPNKRFNVLDY